MMIVVLLSFSNKSSIATTIEPDSVYISIDYIRKANGIFLRYDKLKAEQRIYTQINTINADIIVSTDSIVSNLNSQISNTQVIYNTNITSEKRETRKYKLISVGAIGLAILAILL